jgi:hypothetical protein
LLYIVAETVVDFEYITLSLRVSAEYLLNILGITVLFIPVVLFYFSFFHCKYGLLIVQARLGKKPKGKQTEKLL